VSTGVPCGWGPLTAQVTDLCCPSHPSKEEEQQGGKQVGVLASPPPTPHSCPPNQVHAPRLLHQVSAPCWCWQPLHAPAAPASLSSSSSCHREPRCGWCMEGRWSPKAQGTRPEVNREQEWRRLRRV